MKKIITSERLSVISASVIYSLYETDNEDYKFVWVNEKDLSWHMEGVPKVDFNNNTR